MSATTKENFSGPKEILDAAVTAANLKFGDRNGSWSRWLVEAIKEKLALENPDLLAAIKDLAGAGGINDHTEFLAKMAELAAKKPALKPKFEKLARQHLRGRLQPV